MAPKSLDWSPSMAQVSGLQNIKVATFTRGQGHFRNHLKDEVQKKPKGLNLINATSFGEL